MNIRNQYMAIITTYEPCVKFFNIIEKFKQFYLHIIK